MDDLIPLELVNDGQWAEVAEVCGDPTWVVRMAELGVRLGSRLKVIRSGRPCILQIGEARLSLRGDQTLQILVRPVSVALKATAGK